ncbi:arabinogalactan endo-1,4-beta-galactosidase precursor [Acetivibrio straminisolvens JCM 21531]|uniref:Arabinogalactan endo-beta-1,4-galactanase n=1 Tax=Acetivibrio straminisolvens JCM 21531 TaxID=1294263 RepID=W4V1M8_9FIRM|nr:arabinogalactan endo-1,4-beta-galactosidase precursor [Acetivibrio straminisolvens JCM 21531]
MLLKAKKTVIIFISVLAVMLFSIPKTYTQAAEKFAKGADVSWLPEMEANGYKFYNGNEIEQDCLQILKDHGIDSIRLRVWVNPPMVTATKTRL